jgi:alpha-D-ribose 1-methylphosphonate 5-triphosphate synthase subunit PhnG
MSRTQDKDQDAARGAAMATLAKADGADITALLDTLGSIPEHETLRGPETGLVTVRGRIGGGGAPFNVGEATVTRATVRLATGQTGHAYALGRDHAKARMSAIVDALWQDTARRAGAGEPSSPPRRDGQAEAAGRLRAEAAATKVDFFTMVRGED